MKKLEKSPSFWFLFITSFVYFLLRVPSLFEPIWYGDEALYQVVGKALSQGRVLYTGIWDNKPPLLYYFYALFAGDQFAVRLASIFVGIGSIILLFLVSRYVLQTLTQRMVATGVFAFFLSSPMLMGNTFNAEHLLLPFVLGGVLLWFTLNQRRNATPRHYLWVGVLFGLGFMVKVNPLFDFAACMGCLLYGISRKDEALKIGKTIAWSIVGFLLPLLFFVIIFAIQGNLGAFLTSAFVGNVGYATYTGSFFLSGQFLLIMKLLCVLAAAGTLYVMRARIPQSYLFLILWSVLSMFSVLLTQRSYAHYAILILPTFILLGTCIFSSHTERVYRIMRLPLLAAILLVLWIIQPNLQAQVRYYPTFVAYVTNMISLNQYFSSFDSRVPRDYDIAQFLATRQVQPKDLLVWGDNPQVYTLSNTLPQGPLVVAYHAGFSKTMYAKELTILTAHPPKFIVVYPSYVYPPIGLGKYVHAFTINGVTIYESDTLSIH